MGFFDKLKDKAKGIAGETLKVAAETAQDKVKDAVSDKVTGVAQQAVGGALAHVGVEGNEAAANAAKAATGAAVEIGVNVTADATTTAITKPSGEQTE